MGNGRADHDGGVGDPSGDHDVGALLKGTGDAEATEVGVGGERVAAVVFAARAAQVIALDVRAGGVETQATGHLEAARPSVVSEKSVSVTVALAGRRYIKTKNSNTIS